PGVQGLYTGPANPRAIFFNDAVTVGYIRGAPLVEIAVHDPEQGVLFYTLEQKPQPRPLFERRPACLSCHQVYSTLHVPGMVARSVFVAPDGLPLSQFGSYDPDDRTLFRQRAGGLSAVRRRGAAHRRDQRYGGFRREVCRAGPGRQPGQIVAATRPRTPSAEVSLQLHGLLDRIWRFTDRRAEGHLRPHVGRSLGAGHEPEVRAAVRGRPARPRGDSARDAARSAGRFQCAGSREIGLEALDPELHAFQPDEHAGEGVVEG